MNSNKADSDSLMQHTASPMTSSGNEDFKQDHTTRASAERPKAHSPPTGQFRCCIHQLQCPQITPSVNITKKKKIFITLGKREQVCGEAFKYFFILCYVCIFNLCLRY